MSALSLLSAIKVKPARDTASVLEAMAARQRGWGAEKCHVWMDPAGGVGLAASGGDRWDAFYRSDNDNLTVVFTGRLTNHRQVLHERCKKNPGPPSGFAEIIARLYLEHGVDCLNMLQGYFCFVLWDGNRQELHAARDPMGALPLFYSEVRDDTLFVSSQIAPILATNMVTASLDREAIAHYLHDKSFLQPSTPYSAVRSFRPGTRLVHGERGLHMDSYHRIRLDKEEMNQDEAVGRADELLRAILEEQVAPFDRIGVCFSGGVDSLLLTAMIKALTDKPVHTYTVWTGSNNEDMEFAHEAARYFGTSHRMIELKGDLIKNHLPAIVEGYPTPAVGGWQIYMSTKGAREDGIGIAFSGHGAEISFGLDWNQLKFDRIHSLLRFLDLVPLSFQKAGCACLNRLLTLYGDANIQLLHDYLERRLGIQYWNSSKLTEKRIHFLFPTGTRQFRSIGEHYRNDYLASGSADFLDQQIYSRLVNFEGNHAQGKNNHLAQHNGVELALPFMDRRFLDFGLKIPHALKNIGGQYKYLEVRLAKKYHQFERIERKKAAFSMPFGNWLREELRETAEDAFSEENLKRIGCFRHEAVREIWRGFLDGSETLHWTDIQAFISLDLWLRQVGQDERLA